MKIYTEEQIRESLNDNFNFGDRAIDFALSKMTPIELPSDEEIWGKIEDSTYSLEYDTGFAQGVKWVVEQIKQQDNA